MKRALVLILGTILLLGSLTAPMALAAGDAEEGSMTQLYMELSFELEKPEVGKLPDKAVPSPRGRTSPLRM